MFGKIKSALSKVKNTVGGILSKAASSLGANAFSAYNTLTSGGSGNFNNAPNTSNLSPNSPKLNQTLVPTMSTPAGLGATAPNGQTVIYGSGGRVNQLATVMANSGTIGGGAGSSSSSASPIFLMGGSSVRSTPTQATSFLSSPSQFTSTAPSSISASVATSPASQVSLPSAPTVANYGPVNNAGLANESLKYNPATGQLEAIPQANQMTPEEQAKIQADILRRELELVPQKEDVLQSPEVLRQQAEVQRRQQEVNDYTAQLNSIVAKQNQDLLQLESVGAREGVTEAVYGGQAAAINREAAIKALPVQAALAAAQGNLGLAQDYLKQVMDIKTEQVNNNYNYRLKLYDAISGFVTKEQERILEEKKTQLSQAFQLKLATINDVRGWSSALISSNPQAASRLAALDHNSPTYAQEAAAIIGTVTPKTDNTGLNISGLTDTQAKNLSGYLGEVPTYKSREEALAALNSYKSKIIIDTGVDGYNALAQEIDRQFPPATPVEPAAVQTNNSAANSYGRALGQDLKPLVQGPAGLINNVTSGIGNFFSGLFSQ